MIRWTGLAPWEFEFPFPGSLTSTFLEENATLYSISLFSDKIVDLATQLQRDLIEVELDGW